MNIADIKIYSILLLPDDILFLITKNLSNNIKSLLNFRETCNLFKNMMSFFKLKQIKIKYLMDDLFINGYKTLECCVNDACYWESYSSEYDNYRKYIHFHQNALNTIKIHYNNEYIKINMPYCYECMRNNSLKDKNISLEEITIHPFNSNFF